MSSVREQVLQAALAKIDAARVALGWATTIRNPREPLGADQVNSIVFMDGGEPAPDGLTGHVDDRRVDFSIGLLVQEAGGQTAEQLIDAGYVAVSDALLDPTDMQLGGIAVSVEQGATSEPVYGRGDKSVRIMGGISMDFSVRYFGREGDASTPGP